MYPQNDLKSNNTAKLINEPEKEIGLLPGQLSGIKWALQCTYDVLQNISVKASNLKCFDPNQDIEHKDMTINSLDFFGELKAVQEMANTNQYLASRIYAHLSEII